MDLRSQLAKNRVSEQFGLGKKPAQKAPSLADVPEVYEPLPEVFEDTATSEGLSKFVEIEKTQKISQARKLIQEEVNRRMSETENEQFDIDWDDNSSSRDLEKWQKTLIKFGRNTSDIDKIVKELEEIDNG